LEPVEVIDRIKQRINDMSSSQRAIAEFFIEHYDKAVFMTAAKVGRAVGVSESTVVRFASALGYEGYPEFQEALQEVLKSKLTTVDRLVGSTEGLDEENWISRVFQDDMELVARTMTEVDYSAVEQAVKMLSTSKRVRIIGYRSTFSLAFFMGFYLRWILPDVSVLGYGTADMYDQMANIGVGDTVVALSFPRYSMVTVELIRLARENGANTIAITDSVLSPLTEYADTVLLAKSGFRHFADSFVGPLSLVNVLVAGVGALRRGATIEALDRLEKLWETHEVYWKPGSRKK